METRLAFLSVDILHPILALISAQDIGNLWFSGDARLRTLMGAGAVSRFELEFAHSFPGLVPYLRVTACKIAFPAYEHCFYSFTRDLNLTLLPSTLKILELHIPNALSQIYLLPPASTLGLMFPNLTTLSFSKQYRPKYDRQSLLASMPSSLRTLRLPRNVGFDIASVLCLPCALSELAVTLDHWETGEEERFRAAPIFENLQTLSLFVFSGSPWSALVPATVLDLTCHPAELDVLEASNYVFKQPADDWDSFLSRSPYEASDLRALPPLTRLDIGFHKNVNPELAQALPRSLTELSWREGRGRQIASAQLLRALPSSLTSISTWVILIITDDEIKCLPPSLTSWPSLRFKPATNVKSLALPNFLRTLHVSAAHDDQLNSLSKNLTHLYLHDLCDLSPEGISKLRSFAFLKSLTLEKHELDISALVSLPPLLEYLELVTPKATGLKMVDWTTFWPTGGCLRHVSLNLHSSISLGPVCPSFWTSFPSSITSLWTYIHPVADFPSSFDWMPRVLESLTLVAPTQETLTDRHLSTLPASLLEATLLSFETQLTTEAFRHLPKDLLQLELPAGFSWPQTKLAECESSAADKTAMLDFINHLPRFLNDSIFRRDYAEALKHRQLDDLAEACPNVSFDDIPPGCGRPYNTLKRSFPVNNAQQHK